MKKFVSISLWAMALLVGVCLTACSFHEDVDASLCPDDGYYIKMTLNLPNELSTRAAVPTAGEDGDGREDGKNHEDDINDIMVFVFRSSDGFDAAATTTFLYKKYFVEGCENWTTTATGVEILFKLNDYYPFEGDRVIVVANTGDLTSTITTLGQLRDYTNYTTWTNDADITKDKNFVMSSAYNNSTDGIVHVDSYSGSYSDPYIANINIQRAAARIDFMFKDANVSGTELVYDVKENPNNSLSKTISKVHVQNIIPVNLMQETSYMIKRVANSIASPLAVNYGALETTDASGVPTNYVIEPHTLLKESTVDDATLNTWYGSTRAKTVFADPTSYLTGTDINSYISTKATTTDLGFEKSMILAYTNENTQSESHNSPDFLTGLLLKAIYQPLKVFKSYGTPLVEDEAYTAGTTFWRYKPTKAEMTESDCRYFSNEAAALAYKAANPEDLATITEYPGGVCYYTIWLRHANIEADPHDTFPMEYGIVRNNIYRVGINQYTGPGAVLPEYWYPDNMNLRIFVRKWNLRKQPEIRL